MNITSIMDLNSVTQKKYTNSNKKNNFKDFLDSTVNHNKISKELNSQKQTQSTGQLKEEVIRDIKELIDDNKFSSDSNKDQIQANDNESSSLLLKQIQEIYESASSLEELIDSLDNLPGVIGILSIGNILSDNGKLDFTDIMSKLNKLLKAEFPSFKVPDELNINNMLNAIDQMNLEDKAFIEGQLFLSSNSDQFIDDLVYYERLLRHIEKSSEFHSVKGSLESIFSSAKSNENIAELISSDDIEKIRSLINRLINSVNTVEKSINQNNGDFGNLHESTFSIHLDNYVNKEKLMTADGQKNNVNDDFTNQMLAIIKKGRFSQFGNGTNRLVINLSPEHLGSITIKILQQNGKMVAKIIAATQSAKELLEHSAQQLKLALPNIKVDIERFELMPEQTAKTYKENQDTNEDKEKNHRESSSKNEEETKTSFIDSLNDALNITV